MFDSTLSAKCERGMLQVMMVLMQNSREVPSEWQIKAPSDAANWAYFKCEPEQGLLPPGQKQLLKVSPAWHACLRLHAAFGCREAHALLLVDCCFLSINRLMFTICMLFPCSVTHW